MSGTRGSATPDALCELLGASLASATLPAGCLDPDGGWLMANAALDAALGGELVPLTELASRAGGTAPKEVAALLSGRCSGLRIAPAVPGVALDIVALGAPGEVQGFLVRGEDRRPVEQALAERETLFALTPDLLAVIDASERFIESNPAWEATLGWPVEALQGRPLLGLVHADDAGRTAAFLREVREGLADAGFRARVHSRFGGYRWLEWTAHRLDEARLYCIARDVTDQVRARDAMLRHREELEQRIAARTSELDSALARLQLHADNSPLATIEWDARLRVVHWSARAVEMFGWHEDEVTRRTLSQWPFVSPADARDVGDAMDRLFRGECSRHVHTVRMRTRDGRVRICEWFDSALFDTQGRVSSILSLVQDVTERHAATTALQDSEERFRLAFEQTAIGMAYVDLDGHFLRVNQRLRELTGPLAAAGAPYVDALHPDDRDVVSDGLRALREGRVATFTGEVRLPAKARDDVWTSQSISLRRDGEGIPVHYIVAVEDISERRAAEVALQKAHEALEAKVAERTRELERVMAVLEGQVRQDPLTGLPNRRGLTERLARALDRGSRQGSATVVMFVDLDRFKQVNDRFGHEAGDALLRECARRLQGAVRRTDIVARLGGDEFVVVLENVRAPESQARHVAEKIRDALASPVVLEAANVSVSASIGVVMHQPGDPDVDALIARADRHMYEAKHVGGNAVRLQAPSLP